MLLVAAAMMAGGSALASAQPQDRDGGRDYDRARIHDRDDRRFRDRDDYRFRDRDDYRFRDRDDHRIVGRVYAGRFVGERRFFNGFYWNWDGHSWCRR
jgi:hypothetical protein